MPAKNSRTKKKNGRVIGVIFTIVALLLLVAFVSHQGIDDDRISGKIDGHLNPFENHYHNQAGLLGAIVSMLMIWGLGWLAYFLPLGLLVLGMRMIWSSLSDKLQTHTMLLFGISVLSTMIFNIHTLVRRTVGFETDAAGGYISEKLTGFSLKIVGETGSYLLLGGIVLVLLMIYTSVTPFLSKRLSLPGLSIFATAYRGIARIGSRLVGFISRIPGEPQYDKFEEYGADSESGEYLNPDVDNATVRNDLPDDYAHNEIENDTSSRPRGSRRKAILKRKAEPEQITSVEYSYPKIELLSEVTNQGPSVTTEELIFSARMLKETLETFGVRIDGEIERFPGPVITRFEFKPAAGIKVNQILGLSDDLALAMKARRIRIIAPIPGKAAVGVEIPNRNPQTVYLRNVIDSDNFNDPSIILPLALGKTTSGDPFVVDLAKMPHLLIAGATGSGKSVCMNILITSLMYRLHPLRIRFIFIDPKMLELSVYSGIPHLGRPVVTKPRRAEKVLADAVVEMENRYRRLANASVRNIEDYNRKQESEEDKLPYIVIMVDELADLLMSTTSSKTELLITRLAQMARAVGIHIILATQRPSVDVLTGLIKANFPARIAFQVASKVDSRTILDGNGAEKLLGNGDMLYLGAGQPESIRVHGAFISGEDTDKLVNFVKDQGLSMQVLESISQATGDVQRTEVDLGDPLFREACEVVIRHKQGSVSLLQRRLGIGYQRAARLIDKLEQAGVVSTFDGSKAREVMVDRTYLESVFGKPSEPVASDKE